MSESMTRQRVITIAAIVAAIIGLFIFIEINQQSNEKRIEQGSDKRASYLQERTPRCLSGFNVTAAGDPKVQWAISEKSLKTGFDLKCSCGGDIFQVMGYYVNSPSSNGENKAFVGSIDLKCESCGKVTELIDPESHGYNPETDNETTALTGSGKKQPYPCDKCSSEKMTVTAWFAYPSDILDRGVPGFRNREQDLFTRFALIGHCTICGKDQIVTEFKHP